MEELKFKALYTPSTFFLEAVTQAKGGDPALRSWMTKGANGVCANARIFPPSLKLRRAREAISSLTLVVEFEDLGGGEVDVVDSHIVDRAVHLPGAVHGGIADSDIIGGTSVDRLTG